VIAGLKTDLRNDPQIIARLEKVCTLFRPMRDKPTGKNTHYRSKHDGRLVMKFPPHIVVPLPKFSLRATLQLNERPLTRQQGEDLANSLGAYRYVECSAKAKIGLKQAWKACTNDPQIPRCVP
jgi:hypothetical protein